MSAAGAVATVRPAAAPARLSLPTRLLHWGVALAVVGMLTFGWGIQWLPGGPGKGAAIQAHKSFGMLALTLVLARALWRWREGFPPPAGPHRAWERRAAMAAHGALIAATLLMPLSGILRSLAYARPIQVFGLPVIPRLFEVKHEALYAAASAAHDGLALALAGLVALHAAAALKHHLIDRDDTLRRMIGLGGAGAIGVGRAAGAGR